LISDLHLKSLPPFSLGSLVTSTLSLFGYIFLGIKAVLTTLESKTTQGLDVITLASLLEQQSESDDFDFVRNFGQVASILAQTIANIEETLKAPNMSRGHASVAIATALLSPELTEPLQVTLKLLRVLLNTLDHHQPLVIGSSNILLVVWKVRV